MIKKVKLGSICDIYSAGDKPKQFSETETAELNIPVYGNGRDNEGLVGFTDKAGILSKAVTVAARGSSCGVAFYRTKPYMPIVRLLSLVAKPGIDTKYLYYQVSNRHFTGAGSGQPQITIPDIADAPIHLETELEIQEALSNVLYILDEKITNNNAICSNLEAMAKLLYDYWFVQFDFPDENGKPYKSSGGKMVWNAELKREIPEGWEIKKISDFCRVFTGKKDVNQANDTGLYKFYSCAPEYRHSDEKMYEGKAILVSGNGSYTGRTIFVNDAFDLYQRTYACTPLTKETPLEYIYYSMLRFFVPVVSGGTHGSAIPYIVYGDIADHRIVSNRKTVNSFIAVTSKIQGEIISLQDENQQLAELRDFLLPMLMNGQVKVKA